MASSKPFLPLIPCCAFPPVKGAINATFTTSSFSPAAKSIEDQIRNMIKRLGTFFILTSC
ncbi:MAG: hypothetical protein DRP87_19225 [Spirochaetes bacterium]|nr:MAG: hypothetical protein DRP87_19225 [Spirochaetota bacterium]